MSSRIAKIAALLLCSFLATATIHAQTYTRLGATQVIKTPDNKPDTKAYLTVFRVIYPGEPVSRTPKTYYTDSSGYLIGDDGARGIRLRTGAQVWLYAPMDIVPGISRNPNAGTQYTVPASSATQLEELIYDLTLFGSKGSSIWGTTNGKPSTLAAGTDGYLLVADSAQTLGVKWAAFAPSLFGSQSAHNVLIGPTTGSAASPTFRALVAGDIPDLSGTYAAASHTHTLSNLTQSGATSNQVPQWNGSAWVPATINSAVWGAITGTLSSQTDLQNALNLKANLASPTFTGTVALPTTTLAGTLFVNSTNGLQFGNAGGAAGATLGFIAPTADGVFRFGDSAGGGSPKLILGSAGPSTGVTIKRTGTTVALRNGDDSGDASLTAANAAFSGTITSGTWNGAVIGSAYGGAGAVNGLLKANGSGVVSAALAGDIPDLSATYLPLAGGTLTGQMQAELRDKGGTVFNVLAYGAVADGTTDNTTAVNAAISAALAAGGGIIYFPPAAGKYRINSQILIPNDSASPVPHQKPLRFLGGGAHFAGIASPIYGESVLDLRYTGTTGKIVTLGLGLLSFENITLTNGGADSLPFIYTTNTTLQIKRTAFIGSSAASPYQDAMVMGGQGTDADGTVNGYFQGYGAVIEGNYFSYIHRGMYLQRHANAIVFRDNTFWNTCGGTAAVQDWNDATVQNAGLTTTGNLIEMNHYTYGFRFDRTIGNVMTGDNFYDADGTFTAYYYFGSASTARPNIVLPGYYDAATASKLCAGAGCPALPVTTAAGTLSLLDGAGGYTNSSFKTGRLEVVGNRIVLRAANNDEVFNFYTPTGHDIQFLPVQSDGNLRFADYQGNVILKQNNDGTYQFKNNKASTGYTYWEVVGGAGQSTIPLGRWKDLSGTTGTTVNADGSFTFNLLNGSGNAAALLDANGKVARSSSLTESGGNLISSGDFGFSNSTKGVILKSPGGTCYRISVDNSGVLSTASTTCP